jgi:transcriptional regulator with XRE-family HTH domain
MSTFLREFSGLGSRPYPLDRERRRRVMVVLAEKNLSISDLARSLDISRAIVSKVVSGRRISPKTEQCIAEFLDKPVEYLFPSRTAKEIGEMRRAEAAAKERAA